MEISIQCKRQSKKVKALFKRNVTESTTEFQHNTFVSDGPQCLLNKYMRYNRNEDILRFYYNEAHLLK